MRTPPDGFSSDDRQEAKDSRYPGRRRPGRVVGGAQPALTRIAVKSVNRIVIVQVADIVRIEAEDNYVRLWADRPYLHKETLTGLVARLSPLTSSCASTARTPSTSSSCASCARSCTANT